MTMRILELYRDFRVDYTTEGHKHTRDGWVNVSCPFCTGNPGYHLGYNIDENYFHCWRCGGKPPYKTIAAILHISDAKARQIVRQYGGIDIRSTDVSKKIKVGVKPFKFPSGDLRLTDRHISYLEQRNFDAEKLQREWNLMGTGPIAMLDNVNYSHRILAPIEWEGEIVSFQTRDITNKQKIKYLACVQERERIAHQQLLYGKPSEWGKRGICVEGITDVWRLGPKSFAVFGIDYTIYQLRKIKDIFEEIIILFDPDPQAMRQARKLAADLRFLGLKVHVEYIGTDPGDMKDDDAKHLIDHVLGLGL